MTDYREHAPQPDLARYIECFWSRTRTDSTPAWILPDGCVDILFTSTGGLEVVGLMTVAHPSEAPAGTRYFGLRFHPAMASAFLPDSAELVNRVVPLADLWKPFVVRRLEDRLATARTPTDAIRAMEAEMPDPRPIPQGEYSERHYRRLYRDASGVSPKFMQRILRFRRASEAARRLDGRINWAHFAAAHGYFDQAHFIREFQEFTGFTPVRYLQSLAQASLVA